MPRLMLNYMRLVAVLLLALVSIAIVVSYSFIPKIFAVTLADFYQQYWHLLTILFVIATLFLGFAFHAERTHVFATWVQHLVSLILIGWFAYELVVFIKVGDLLFAVVD